MTHKIHFDPLYGAVAFRAERLGLDDFWATTHPLSDDSNVGALAKHMDDILGCHEINRLNYLRQAGFSWLIYPSATHTRYAHSLGCWYLGEQAMDSVQVVVKQRAGHGRSQAQRRFLIDWLRSSNLQEEFMLALLLHDVGHFPFSHVIEQNPDYCNITHEEVGTQYIKGEGEVAELLRDTSRAALTPARQHGLCFLAEALGELRKSVLNVDVVCALITGDSSYISHESEEIKEKTLLLKQLVSGVVDLDRIDHYHRDSFSMGLRIGYVNPIALLAGLELSPSAAQPECWVRLSDTGIMQGIALLSTRDMLIKNVFDYSSNVAYGVMLNFAISQVVRDNPALKLRMLTWTDEELLSFLLEYDFSPIASGLAARILARRPYERIGRYKVINPDYDNIEGLERVKQWLVDVLLAKGIRVDSYDILIQYSRHMLRGSASSTMWKEWFDMEKLQTLDGITLADHDMYSRQIRFLAEQYLDYDKMVQFFASSRAIAIKAQEALQSQRFLDRTD